ncbi:TetR/AcrR family transcriptional regulator [Lichenifustis flavocetrariae]|uniref:TetR/AcrR family transcriptional regulator n=1 Tax=Lichenifustis flavocetrariae TaxID=2949735 RepID=A0AA41YY80_9HYPH|nr:TetR/AcrR family transcriptional regulator [Lichenifustis flavocetrariae]MCW6509238.1 TetR/AcrR family transcriptional regulator [Lichenifustis flavocetrariae]
MNRASSTRKFAPRKLAHQERATRTVDAILEGAAHILEKLGFEGYTTNAIADRAGVSIGSLYQYFPNKDAVTLALIERESAVLVREIEAAAEIPEWREAIRGMNQAAVRHQLRRPVLARLLDVEEARLPTRDPAAPGAGAIFGAMTSVLARAELTGSVQQIATDLMGITRGLTDMAGRAGDLDADDLERRVHQAVFGYLGGRSGAPRR